MKVCHICAVDFTLNHFLLPLINRMKNEGWDVYAICSRGSNSEDLINKGYNLINVDIPRNLNPVLIIRAIISLYKEFKKNKFDIIHVHTPVASVVGRIAAKLAGVPFVIYTAHGFYFHENMSSFKFYIYLYIEKFFAYFTDLIFFQSIEDYNLSKKYNFLHINKLIYIGNGVDSTVFVPKSIIDISKIKKKLGLPDHSIVIGSICRLVKEKGILEFLDAAEMIKKKYPNVYFLLIGSRLDTEHNTNINKQIFSKKQILGDKLLLLGHRNDIPELLSILDIFCLPSWREGLSRSIIEAMFMAKPIITTNIRGCREQVDHKKNGLIIPIKSSKKIFNSIRFLINDPDIRKKFGKNARKKAIKFYDEKNVISFQIKIIKEKIKNVSCIKKSS